MMAQADPRVEAFFGNAKAWRDELAALRAILLDSPLSEEFKWRSPCYTFRQGNVATLWGLKESCVLGFFKGVLLKDPAGLLVAPGENSRSVRMIRVTSVAEIAALDAVLRDYVRQAIEAERAGLKVDFRKDDLAYPEEFVDRLDADPELRSAFDALTPGRQRGYVLHFSRPKQSKTRTARIDKSAPKILAGKGLDDR